MSKRLWLDTHVHVSDYGSDGQLRPRFLEDLLQVLDSADVDLRFVISCDGPRLSRLGQSGEGVIEGNEFIQDLVTRAPDRLYGGCMVNPHFLDESLHMMDVCFGEWGFVYLGEMLPYMMDYVMDSPPVEKLVERAIEFDVPVHVHLSTSNPVDHSSSLGMEQLKDFCALADKLPEAHYILAHAVGMPTDNPPVVDKYLDYLDERYGTLPDNFWLEIRDFDSPGVRSALARVPADRLIAGTDWVTRVGPPFLPYGCIFGVQTPEENPYPPRVETMIGFLKAAGADDETIDLIGSENALSLLDLEP